MILKTGPTTDVGSTITILPFPFLERANDKIELRPELSMNVTSVMSRHTSPAFWKASRAAVSCGAL